MSQGTDPIHVTRRADGHRLRLNCILRSLIVQSVLQLREIGLPTRLRISLGFTNTQKFKLVPVISQDAMNALLPLFF